MTTTKAREILTAAKARFETTPNWVTFYREILGQDGLVRQLYKTREELASFEKTEAYSEIQAMLAQKRAGDDGSTPHGEPCRVITVRMPASVHEALNDEAHTYKTSVNQLCLAKLMQILDAELVPTDRKKRDKPAL